MGKIKPEFEREIPGMGVGWTCKCPACGNWPAVRFKATGTRDAEYWCYVYQVEPFCGFRGTLKDAELEKEKAIES